MTSAQRAPRASEAPFDRLGGRVEEERQVRVWPLNRGATIWAVAHVELGDWRRWREIATANDLADPLDLAGLVYAPPSGAPAPAPFIMPSATPGGAPVEVDLAADLGVGPQLILAAPEMRGVCYLVVEDVAPDVFTLAVAGPGDTVAGPPVAVTAADFEGLTPDTTQEVQRALVAQGGGVLVVRFDLNAWLAMWLARRWPLLVVAAADVERDELVVPQTGALGATLLGAP